MMSSEPNTPSEDELVRTYVEHLGPITLGTEFARQQEARRGLNKVKADALREATDSILKQRRKVSWRTVMEEADQIEEEA